MSRPAAAVARIGRLRWARGAVVVLAVVAMHGWVTDAVTSRMREAASAAMTPERLAVTYVRTLEMSAPEHRATALRGPSPPRSMERSTPWPVASASAASAVKRTHAERRAAMKPTTELALAAPAVDARAAEASAGAASAAMSAMDATSGASSAPTFGSPLEPVAASASSSASPLVTSTPAPISTATATAASASSPSTAAAFEWPASTRVTYELTGNYRGAVSGHAQVEWIRVGVRYQVHIDLVVGPDFAPLITRRMSSDGTLGNDGLVPSRYDEDTKVVLRDARHATVLFEPGAVVIANGERRERMAGVQDTASQFLQLTWLFSTRPDLLRVGERVEVPLALPRRTDRWIYDVLDEETLYTSFGPVRTVHLKPQRASKKPGDLSAEVWFAPELRHLPVRIRIEQDAETFIDMTISKKPELAGG